MVAFVYVELSGHTVAEAFYNGELESELRRIGKLDYRLKRDSDRDSCMEMVEKIRCQSIYVHCEDQGRWKLFYFG